MAVNDATSDPLARLGWRTQWADKLEDALAPGRVAQEQRGSYTVMTATGETQARVSGRMRHAASSRDDLPAVGDWVGMEHADGDGPAVIQQVLPRASAFYRKVAGDSTEPQIVAANVDVLFLVSALNQDLNPRRVERYLTMAWESGATPVIVASKVDLCEDRAAAVAELSAVASGADLHLVSAVTGEGLEALADYLEGQKTAALLGSSGVGKSTIVNRLMDAEVQTVKAIRGDGKGRHTTTHRELILLPNGGLIIDTPGMRELQLWVADEGLDATFEDIAELAAACKFRDCGHTEEPACAVLAALHEGRLSSERLESYRKLQKELAWLERKKDKRLASEEARRWKKLTVEARARTRHR